MPANFERMTVRPSDDGGYIIEVSAPQKQSKKGEPTAYVEPKTMLAANHKELMKKVDSILGGNSLKKFFDDP